MSKPGKAAATPATTAWTLNSSAPDIRRILEERRGDAPLFVHPDWEQEFPWLVQGTTPRAAGNFASFGDQPAMVLHSQWRRLRAATGLPSAVLGWQVHGARMLKHDGFANGLLIADDSDGHSTTQRGVLLAVSVADCVPVFVVDVPRRAVAVLHAGWRGVARGIMGNCLAVSGPDVRVHLGPAICGACYAVGPEVHTALGLSPPLQNAPVDLRAILAEQACASGVSAASITSSAWCTRCGDSPFYSHRGGHAERQVAVIGMR